MDDFHNSKNNESKIMDLKSDIMVNNKCDLNKPSCCIQKKKIDQEDSLDQKQKNYQYVNGVKDDINGNPTLASIELIDFDNLKVYISIGDVKLSHYYLWLRDSCRCKTCFNETFLLRSLHLLDIPENIKPTDVYVVNGKLHIEWVGGHQSEYSADFLLKNNHQAWVARQKRKLVYWRGDEVKDKVAEVTYDDFMNSEEALKKVMESILIYGLAFVNGVNPVEEETEIITRRIGPPQASLFGTTWNISTENNTFQDAAFTNDKITFHTDNTYFSESTGLLMFHLLQAANKGGDTVLIDTFDIVKRLETSHPKDMKILSTKKITTEYHERGFSFKHTSPVLKYNEFDGEPEHIRFNINDRSIFTSIPEEETLDYYIAIRRLAKEFEDSRNQWWFSLKPGRVLLFDNWRLVHGRSQFQGKRYLSGSYISRSDWTCRARTLGLID